MAACATIVLLCSSESFASAQTDTSVRVIGRGETTYEARQDAIRQALQQAVEQLVISQQVVSNDRLVLDKISSTMNGFVSEFTPVRTWVENGEMLIEADVVISQSRIENFIGLTKGSRVSISSENILAAAQAERLARTARSEIAIALLQDFPASVIEASPVSLSMNANDPDYVDMKATVRWSTQFLRSVEQGMNALGATRIDCRVRERHHHGECTVVGGSPFFYHSAAAAHQTAEPNTFSVCFDPLGEWWESIDITPPPYSSRCWVLSNVDLQAFHPEVKYKWFGGEDEGALEETVSNRGFSDGTTSYTSDSSSNYFEGHFHFEVSLDDYQMYYRFPVRKHGDANRRTHAFRLWAFKDKGRVNALRLEINCKFRRSPSEDGCMPIDLPLPSRPVDVLEGVSEIDLNPMVACDGLQMYTAELAEIQFPILGCNEDRFPAVSITRIFPRAELVEYRSFENIGSIGFQLFQKNGQVTVNSVIGGGAAERAGVRSGDQIIAINGIPTVSWSVDKVVKQLRGPPGMSVRVSVQRDGSKPFDFTIVRE